ncbi:DUF6243 family protein [Streptomyces sp. NPDC088190]|uniref:DUF6243 family protein n=1 Tax=unclassified Streptomyces TaxID=2593676 RepID=UPI002E782B20|nr:DUF6243 family protein [Streptomyces sp. JV190]MEE1843580.1 DUF6243 family protein [Streptomyces sp. JV190]
MAKSRNNLLGVGGQRKKLSRAEQQGVGPARDADRKAAADQKQELLRKMRERARPESASDDAAQPDAAGQDAPQS